MDKLMLYARGKLKGSELVAVKVHIDDCELCRGAAEGYSYIESGKVADTVNELNHRINLRIRRPVNSARMRYLSMAAAIGALVLVVFTAWFSLNSGRNEKLMTVAVPGKETDNKADAVNDADPVKNDALALKNSEEAGRQNLTGSVGVEVKPEESMETLDLVMAEESTAQPPIEEPAGGNIKEPVESGNAKMVETEETVNASQYNTLSQRNNSRTDKSFFTTVERMPEFPGGQEKLFQYLNRNLKYPETAQSSGIEGTVVVNFTVTVDGKIKDAFVLRSIDPALDEEALRVVRSMPDWTPGEQSGGKVEMKVNLPVSFKLK